MSRSVLAVIVLASVDASTLVAPVSGYRFTLTETTTGTEMSVEGAVDSTSIQCDGVPAGTYQPSIVCVDANGSELTEPVLATELLTVTNVASVLVNVPASLAARLV